MNTVIRPLFAIPVVLAAQFWPSPAFAGETVVLSDSFDRTTGVNDTPDNGGGSDWGSFDNALGGTATPAPYQTFDNPNASQEITDGSNAVINIGRTILEYDFGADAAVTAAGGIAYTFDVNPGDESGNGRVFAGIAIGDSNDGGGSVGAQFFLTGGNIDSRAGAGPRNSGSMVTRRGSGNVRSNGNPNTRNEPVIDQETVDSYDAFFQGGDGTAPGDPVEPFLSDIFYTVRVVVTTDDPADLFDSTAEHFLSLFAARRGEQLVRIDPDPATPEIERSFFWGDTPTAFLVFVGDGLNNRFDNLVVSAVTGDLPIGIAYEGMEVGVASPVGSIVGSVASIGGEGALTFVLADGEGDTGNSRFAIDGADLRVIQSLADLSDGDLSIRVRVTDENGDFFEGPVAIPLTADSDGDQLPDAFERLFSDDLTLLSGLDGADSDSDGLTDLQEFQEQTTRFPLISPIDNDSDDDTLLDGAEIAAGTDPTDSDSDDDTLADNVETMTGTFVDASDTGTDPLTLDTDEDGRPDGAEVLVAPTTDPTNPDTDNDTFGDALEIGLGSDPNVTGNTPEVGIYTDTFNRPDGETLDFPGGTGGLLSFTGNLTRSANISGNQYVGSGSTSWVVPNQSFTDELLRGEDGYRIKLLVNPVVGGDGTLNQWTAISFGHSQETATGTTGAGAFRLLDSERAFAILFRDRGTMQVFTDSGTIADNVPYDPAFDPALVRDNEEDPGGIPNSPDATYEIEITVVPVEDGTEWRSVF